MMMGFEIPESEFVLDEMNISAICEVMNMMMGASATALSEFPNALKIALIFPFAPFAKISLYRFIFQSQVPFVP